MRWYVDVVVKEAGEHAFGFGRHAHNSKVAIEIIEEIFLQLAVEFGQFGGVAGQIDRVRPYLRQ